MPAIIKMETRSCERCGKVFKCNAASARKYCGPKCREAAKEENRRALNEEWKAFLESRAELVEQARLRYLREGKQGFAVCPVCLAPYKPKAGNQIYCSIDCSNLVRRKDEWQNAATAAVPRTCRQCGRELGKKDVTFCSIECRRAYNAEHSRKTEYDARLAAPQPPLCKFCGKVRTWNHRCPNCLRQWRIKYHVIAPFEREAEEPETEYEVTK